MKNSKNQIPKTNYKSLFSFAFMALFILFQSCSKDDVIEPETPDTTTPSQDEYVKCKIDGKDFLSYDDSRYYHYIANTAGPNKWLNIRGSNVDVNTVTMLFWNFDGVGEYDVSSSQDSCSIQYNIGLTSSTSYVCDRANASAGQTSGKIKVTVHNDTQIEGTFEFTAINTVDPNDKVTITEGSFRILR